MTAAGRPPPCAGPSTDSTLCPGCPVPVPHFAAPRKLCAAVSVPLKDAQWVPVPRCLHWSFGILCGNGMVDAESLVVPFVVWCGAPEHVATCASATPDTLVTGSVSGQLVLWRKPKWSRSRDRAASPTSRTVLERNLELQMTDMENNADDRYKPVAVVVGRIDAAVAITAVCIFQFGDTRLFIAAYQDGLVSVHECLNGDAIISVQLLSIWAARIEVYQATRSDPFVFAVCTPRAQTATQVFVLRVGLGEGYRGSLSIVKAIDHDEPVVDSALLVERDFRLVVLTRARIYIWTLMLAEPPLRFELDIQGMPISLAASAWNNAFAVLCNSSVNIYEMDWTSLSFRQVLSKDGLDDDLSSVIFCDANRVAITHERSAAVDIVNDGELFNLEGRHPGFSHAVARLSGSRRLSIHSTVCVPSRGHLVIVGGDHMPSGMVVEYDLSQMTPRITDMTSLFPSTGFITAFCMFTNPLPTLVTGHNDGQIRVQPLMQKGVSVIRGRKSSVTALTTSSDLLLAGSDDGFVTLWSLKTKTRICQFDNSHCGPVLRFIHVSASRVAAISADNAFSVYDCTFASCLLVAHGHGRPVISFLRSDWADRANYTIAVVDDGTLFVWDTTSGCLDRVLNGKSAREFCSARCLSQWAFPSSGPTENVPVFNQLQSIHSSMSASVFTVDLCRALALHVTHFKVAEEAPDVDGYRRSSRNDSLDSTSEFTTVAVMDDSLRSAISLLLDWTLDPDLDSQLADRLGLFDPVEVIACGTTAQLCHAAFGTVSAHACQTGVYNQQRPFSVTLLLPSPWKTTSRWRFSHRFTALHSLYINTLYMPLMSTGFTIDQSLFSRLLANYGVLLPDALPSYKEPALRVLSAFSLHPVEDVHVAARLLLQSAIVRMSDRRRQQEFNYWSAVFVNTQMSAGSTMTPPFPSRAISRDYASNDSPSKLEFLSQSDENLIAAMVLCILCVHHGHTLKPAVATSITGLLVGVLESKIDDPVRSSLAADLIGKGIRHWQPYLNGASRVMTCLFVLSQREREPGTSAARHAYNRALLEVGALNPALLVMTMAYIAQHPSQFSSSTSAAALLIIRDLVRKYPSTLLSATDILHTAVDVIVKCLDPTEPLIRRNLVRPGTAVLHMLARKYPGVTLHNTAHICGVVGADGRQIAVYDVRSATRRKIFEGHTAAVDAITFDPTGTMLASYSASEETPTVRLWRLNTPPRLISNMLGLSANESRVFNVAPIGDPSQYSPSERMQNISLTWTDEAIELVRQDRSICRFAPQQ